MNKYWVATNRLQLKTTKLEEEKKERPTKKCFLLVHGFEMLCTFFLSLFQFQNTGVFLTTMESSVELIGSPAYVCIVPHLSITPHSAFSGFLRLSYI